MFDLVTRAVDATTSALHSGIAEFTEQAQLSAQTEAAIRSTGGAANVTAAHIDDLSRSLSNLSGIDDELVKAGENVLLSFTNIQNRIGAGNDIFDQATKAVTDFAARTGRDPVTAARLLGKALEDPAGKLSSLSRAGIVFTKQQIGQVAAIQKTKGVMEAQKVVLGELEERFGGAAEAAGKTLPGQLNVLRERFKDLAGTAVGVVAPAFGKVVSSLTDTVRELSEAKTVRARLNIVFDRVDDVGRGLISQFNRIDFSGIVSTIASKIQEQIGSIDFGQIGGEVGAKVGQALRAVADAIGRVNWGAVGETIIRGLEGGVKLVIVALPGILEGIGRLAVRVLASVGSLLLGAGKLLGAQLLHGIEAGLAAVGRRIERLAIGIVLKIIEPFTHLPGFLGGGPFRDIKDALQGQLDEMESATAKTARRIGVTLGAAAEGVAAAISKAAGQKPAAAAPAASPTLPAAPVSPVAAQIPKLATGAAKTVEQGFTLPFRLRLAEARAEATKAAGDDLRIAREIRAFVLKAIPTLKGEKLLAAYQELGAVNGKLAAAVSKAASTVADGFNLTAQDRKRRFQDKRFSQTHREGPVAGRQIVYAPNIVSTDVREGQKLADRDFFRFRQRFAT